MSRKIQKPISRRDFLKMGAAGGSALAASNLVMWLSGCTSGGGGEPTTLNVLTPAAPDPAPPGVADFSMDAFAKWQADNNATVVYESPPWPDLHAKMATNFASGQHVHDCMYNCGWVPEFAEQLIPFVDDLPKELIDDLPPSSFSTVTWDGKRLGVIFTLSLLTLFYNTEHLAEAGISEPPKTWDELMGFAKEMTHDGKYGWVLNYGYPEGIGGVTSYWMVFLQQAGGTMWDDAGMPAFNTSAGVDGLQFMVDMMPYTDPGSISYVGINDATNVFTAGQASMMMNWPFMWVPAQDPESSKIVGKVGTSVLPAGSAGTASIDGTDAYTIGKTSPEPELTTKLIEFYLDKEVQKRQVIDTGWLPIRLSVLNDPEVQAAASNAAAVLEQAKAPYDSFVTPDYNEVTDTMGREIQKALQGTQSAAETMAISEQLVTDIVKKRLG
ncbi:MAG: sugar ABC transporter substrate-binding protein [Anaerolineales bacterium]|jgi:multiple sugar transport system substrate-binding protein|nr:sugar ABC transporter substrate-binding protein [Anaerolineales bacterium]